MNMNLPCPSSPIICRPAAERTDSKRVTINGKRQTLHLCAYGWETRNAWGHSAYCPELGISAKCRYYNRTWEARRFDSVISKLLYLCRMQDANFAKRERKNNREFSKYAKARSAWYEENGYNEGCFMDFKTWQRGQKKSKSKSKSKSKRR